MKPTLSGLTTLNTTQQTRWFYVRTRTFTVELISFVCDVEYLAIDCHVQFI